MRAVSGGERFGRAPLALAMVCAVLLCASHCGSKDEPPAGRAPAETGPAASGAGAVGGAAGSFVVGQYGPGVAEEDKVRATKTPEGAVYAATASAYGYESDIVVRVSVLGSPEQAVGEDVPIHSMEVVASNETPGWADGVFAVRDGEERPWFQAQFTGKGLADLHVDPMDPAAGIEAVTGATITSEGATEAVRKALQRIIDKTEEAYGAGEQ